MLQTMPDLKWTVSVDRWTWVYAFSRKGTVSWRDPFNGMSGTGSWKIDGGKLVIRWHLSKTWEAWDVPFSPNGAAGECYMSGQAYNLWAVALNYYLKPGDVMYFGDPIIAGNGTRACVVYADEVRTGGTVAWICKNPGNIRIGDKYGAFPGKQLQVNKVGGYAIFPTVETGLKAIVTVLRSYGKVTILQAMHKYAPLKDGNDPVGYAKAVARELKVSDSAYLNTVDLMHMAEVITGVETTKRGNAYPHHDMRLPVEVRSRLIRPGPYAPTDEEARSLMPKLSY